jgi:hypothetical protein
MMRTWAGWYAGAARVAIWPDEAIASLWGLPPAELAVTLFQLIETGTGPAAYYGDVAQAVITLAVKPSPPSSPEPATTPPPASHPARVSVARGSGRLAPGRPRSTMPGTALLSPRWR